MIYPVWISLNQVPVHTHLQFYLSYHYTLAHIKDITLGAYVFSRRFVLQPANQFDLPYISGSISKTAASGNYNPTNGQPLCVSQHTL